MQPSAAAPQLAPGNFYGQTLRQHQAGGFSLSETRYLPGSELPRHSHQSPYFWQLPGYYLLQPSGFPFEADSLTLPPDATSLPEQDG